jgi:hypothetical protein
MFPNGRLESRIFRAIWRVAASWYRVLAERQCNRLVGRLWLWILAPSITRAQLAPVDIGSTSVSGTEVSEFFTPLVTY